MVFALPGGPSEKRDINGEEKDGYSHTVQRAIRKGTWCLCPLTLRPPWDLDRYHFALSLWYPYRTCCRQGNWGAGKTCSRWWLTSNVGCSVVLIYLAFFFSFVLFFFSAVCLVWPWKFLHILSSLQVCICSILWLLEFSVSVRLQYQNWPGEGRPLVTGFGIRNPGSMAPNFMLCERRCFWQL